MDGVHAFGKKFTNCFLIPQRYVLVIMTGLATFTSYTMRVALNLGITEMVIKKNETYTNDTDEYCPIVETESYVTVKNTDVLYDWNEWTQGLILGSFYWGYIITHLPGAFLAERIGGKHILGSGMLINCILTIIFPLVVIASRGNWPMVAFLRFLMGLGQGMVYPVVTAILAQWAPAREKTLFSSISFSGALLGTVFTNSVSGVLISEAHHWDIVFYFFGILGLIWNIAWQLLCYSYPRTHPCIKDKEKELLETTIGFVRKSSDVSKESLKTPWKNILGSAPVWAFILVQVGHDWGWYTMVTDLPKYMNSVLRFNITENGFLSSLPFFLMWVGSIAMGFLADWLIGKDHLSIATTRRLFGTIGQTGSAIFMILASYVGCQRMIAVGMFTVSLFLMSFFFAGIKVNPLDLSPNFAGTIMALGNGLGVFAGMAAPTVVGFLTPNQTINEWRRVFWLSFGFLVATNLIYVIFLSTNVQEWNKGRDREDKSS